ncbi:GtrA family protein [Nocardioides aequoreus]|uniref:GtrA family protein n=1 Tax=Nocardioides aequoreus TaxID=397278 RepID=UPI001B800DD5|nr:GtrA family protein [Nocardioides aequoreus]
MSPRTATRRIGHRLDATRFLGSGTQLVARFGTVGLLCLVVDIGAFNLLRYVVEVGPLTSKTISVVLATSLAFLGNRSWTFGHREMRHGPGVAYVLFFVCNGIALAISLVCLAVSSYALGLTSPLAENVSSNVVGLGLGTLFRFWAYGRWVFAPTRPPAPPAPEVGTDSSRQDDRVLRAG